MNEVIIIGAGAAGLAAGQRLREAGWKVLLLEARERIGGRIWTDHRYGPVELGAEFIHGAQATTWQYVQAAGLRTQAWGSDRRFARRGTMLATDDPCIALTYQFYEAVTTYAGPERSVADVMASLADPDEPAAQMTLRWLANLEGADPARLSATALAHERRTSTNGQGNFHLLDGYTTLVTAMAAGLTIKTGAPVTKIAWQRGEVVVTLMDGTQHTAPRVIITVPLGVLQAGAITFTPELPATKQAALERIAMGHVTKLVLWFDRQCWEPFTIMSTDGKIVTWWPVVSTTTPALMGYQGGAAALALAHMSEDQALTLALNELTSLFGSEVRQAWLGGQMSAWSHDPWSNGAYSYSPVGMGSARAMLAAPVDEVLYFAGEACATNGHLATVHGAIETGHQAAEAILSNQGTELIA